MHTTQVRIFYPNYKRQAKKFVSYAVLAIMIGVVFFLFYFLDEKKKNAEARYDEGRGEAYANYEAAAYSAANGVQITIFNMARLILSLSL